MKLFDKKAEKRVWLALMASVPLVFFVLYLKNGEIGLTEIVIASITLIIGVTSLYLVKWYANKD